MARYAVWIMGIITGLSGIGFLLFYSDGISWIKAGYDWITDPTAVTRTLENFGRAAPLVFMVVQVFQVVVAPIPGELSGVVGGYLFGAVRGFFYSSLALSIGSWLGFLIGRYFGRFVRKWILSEKLDRFDRMIKRQGGVALLILFVVPGFPKDYLCLFFGMAHFPMKVFMIIATFGRMPGTLMLSLQGEFLFEQNYVVFGIIVAVAAVVTWLAIQYREPLYGWMEKLDAKTGGND